MSEQKQAMVIPNDTQVRIHDDCEGDYAQTLELSTGPDGDIWIKTNGKHGHDSLRFRTPTFGGGMSQKTYFALVNLMQAMREDNERSNHNGV